MREFSTLTDLIADAREVHPDRGLRLVSSKFREAYHPYADLHRRVLFHADHFLQQDVEAGQRVVLSLQTDIDQICSFLALVWIGAVPVSVSGQMAGQDRGAYLRQILRLVDRFSFDRLLVDRHLGGALSEVTIHPGLTLDPYPQAIDSDRPAPRIRPAPARPEDIAFIQFSSGSTGDPKGVQITHGNIAANLRTIVAHDGRTAERTGVIWLPLYHDMGLVGGFLSNFVEYNSIVLMNPVCFLMKPVTWLDYMSRYRCYVSAAPNFAIDMCNTRIRDHQLEARRPDLGALEIVYNGSEPINAEVIERFYERFGPYGARRGCLLPCYGMAEATLMVTAPPLRSEIATRRVDDATVVSVGRAVGGATVRILGEDGRDMAAGSVGEIAVRGPSVSPGYFENEEENARRFRDGWFRTGDLGLLDEEGRLFITGRIKDLIIVNGRNYYAHDIVSKLEELPFVRRGKAHVFSYNLEGREEVVVMTVLESSMSSAVRGRLEDLKAFLASEAGSWLLRRLGAQIESFIHDMDPSDVELLKDAVKQYLLHEFGLPIHDVFVVRQIPRTSSGKVRRVECEALYREYLEAGTEGSSSE